MYHSGLDTGNANGQKKTQIHIINANFSQIAHT